MAIQRFMTGIAALVVCGVIAAGSITLAFQSPAKPSKVGGTTSSSQTATGEATAARSILKNGGMERGGTGGVLPDSWKKGANVAGVSYVWDRTVAHDGRASLHLEKTLERYWPIAQWIQAVERTGTAPRLKVSAFVQADSVTKAIVDVQFAGRGGRGSHKWAAFIGQQRAGDPPATHPWKQYTGVVDIPAGTTQIIVALQIYGPGNVWFDDVEAGYTNAPATDATAAAPASAPAPAWPASADVAAVPSEERFAGGDRRKRYFLIGPTPAADRKLPRDGYRLVVLLPGGDGSADFQPFCKRIAQNALAPDYLVAELVAFQWSPEQAKRIVWPTRADALAEAGFTTEEFVEAVIADIGRSRKIDRRFIFALAWSSGGPAVYAAACTKGMPLTGSFVAMSVFKPAGLPPRENARGQGFYILHSPRDFIPIAMAEKAHEELSRAGANVELHKYDGGHGWRGDVFGEIRRGIRWLETHHAK